MLACKKYVIVVNTQRQNVPRKQANQNTQAVCISALATTYTGKCSRNKNTEIPRFFNFNLSKYQKH